MKHKGKWLLVLNMRFGEYRPCKITRDYWDDDVPKINIRFLSIKRNKLNKVSHGHCVWNACSVSPYWQDYIDKYEAIRYSS